MQHNKTERVIALAGVVQAAMQVMQVAKAQTIDASLLQSGINSLFVSNPENTLAVYGGTLQNIKLGLTQIAHIDKATQDELTRYVISLIAVDSLLVKHPTMLATIGKRLEHLHYQKEFFSDNFSQLQQSLSSIYQDTISQLAFRIQVLGDREHLTQTAISDKIRTLLLIGVRSARLWRQVGGTKWQLIFTRSQTERISRQLLQQISTSS